MRIPGIERRTAGNGSGAVEAPARRIRGGVVRAWRAARRGAGGPRNRSTVIGLLALVLIPIAFNAITLLPEVRTAVPHLNDDAFHFLFTQRASDALAHGENPFDMWSPVLELGLPPFLYYQHVPMLAVVLLHRVLLQQIGLFTLFNLVRYLLLISFPLTVFWSTRQLGFSPVAAAVAAAASSLLSAGFKYGFEYDSYIWRGFGMYTQLWAMHLTFIALACVDGLLERGKRYYLPAIAACSALVLSHLLYAEMMIISVAVLFLVGLNRANFRTRLVRLAITGVATAVITSYFWLGFLLAKPFLGGDPYLEAFKRNSFGPRTILTWLVKGQLLDTGRLPVLTALLGVGTLAALFTRTRPARVAVAMFVVWLALYFGQTPWGVVADQLPAHDLMLFHRFIGGAQLAAILLIGLGGEWIWRRLTWPARLASFPQTWAGLAAALLLVLLFIPALNERHAFYAANTQYMERTRRAVDADADARDILTALKDAPPGRTFAGLRTDWGAQMRLGDLHFYDLLTFHQIDDVAPPYNDMSLNSNLLWSFDYLNPALYAMFDVRYVVAPSTLTMPWFLHPIKQTNRYTLYETEQYGYEQYVSIAAHARARSPGELLNLNLRWMRSSEPADGQFIQYDYPAGGTGLESGATSPGCDAGGKTSYELARPGRLVALVECPQPATLILKLSYHPNWHVSVDGHEQQTFMTSPSYIGLNLPAGTHYIDAQYRSAPYRTVLLVVGVVALLVTALLTRRAGRRG